MSINRLTLRIKDEQGSKRSKDDNGFLTIKDNPIAKAGVFEYLLSEILPDTKSENDKIVKVYRPFETLAKAKESFANKPIKQTHKWVGDAEPQADGAIGSNISLDEKNLMLKADLIIYNPELIKAIESGELVELSPAYTGEVKEQAGRFEGENYDYTQSVECINHLAVVENGRSGKDLRIQDERTEKMATKKFLDGFKSRFTKFLDDEVAEIEIKKDDDEVKTQDDKSSAVLEIIKGEGNDSEKLAKIAELLAVEDEGEKIEDESEQEKIEDEDETQTCDDSEKIEDSDDDEEKGKEFADTIEKIINAKVEKKLAQFKDAESKRIAKINDSYDKVSKALGSSFDKNGMSSDDIYKFGYELISGQKLGDNMSAETAFNVIASQKQAKFNDSAVVETKGESNILKMLNNL